MLLLLKLVGADTSTAVAAILGCRLATLWCAVIISATVFSVVDVNPKADQGQAPGA